MRRGEWSIRPTGLLERWHGALRVFLVFRPYAWRHRGKLLGAILCVMGGIAVRIAQPWPLKYLFDSVLIPMGGQDAIAFPVKTVLLICGAILGLGMASSFLMYGELVLSASAGQRIATSLRRRLFGHLLTLPLGYHRWSERGETVNLLARDIQNLKELLVNVIMTVSAAVIHVTALLAIMFAINARLAVVATAVLPIVMLSAFRVTRVMRKVNRDQRAREGQLMSSAQEVLRAIPAVKIFGQEAFERRRFAGLNRSSLRAGLRLKRLEAALNRRVELFLAIGACLFIWIGVREVLAGRLTAGELLVFAAYLKGTQKPLRRLSRTSTRIAKAVVCGERIQAVLDVPGESTDETDTSLLPAPTGAIRFEQVGFDYENGHTVLRDASFEVPAGSTVAVVGASGAGKSTLLALIARLYDPSSGTIYLDGMDSQTLPLSWVRRHVSAVFQEPYLFRGAIGDNLRYGRPDADERTLVDAVARARADTFVDRMPDRLNALVGDEAMTLSGGERQRLAIARALLRDAPIVLLDEPTAALDERSRDHVVAGLKALTAGRTCFWSTHDYDQVADVDYTLYVGAARTELRVGPPQQTTVAEWHAWSLEGVASHA